MGICLKGHVDAGFLVNLTLWCLLTIIVKSFVDVFNSLGPSDAVICVSKLNIIGSDDGLSPIRRQAIIWTNAHWMLEYCWLDPCEQISVKSLSKFTHFIQENAFENVVWKMTATLSRPQCVEAIYSNHPLNPYWRWTSFTWLSDNFQK